VTVVAGDKARASVTLCGIADGGVTYIDNAGLGSAVQASSGGKGGGRGGLRGSEDLGQGLAAIFCLENGVDLMTGQSLQNGREFGHGLCRARYIWRGLTAETRR
jgi:predicted porin